MRSSSPSSTSSFGIPGRPSRTAARIVAALGRRSARLGAVATGDAAPGRIAWQGAQRWV
jgi:hypothetical protein